MVIVNILEPVTSGPRVDYVLSRTEYLALDTIISFEYLALVTFSLFDFCVALRFQVIDHKMLVIIIVISCR